MLKVNGFGFLAANAAEPRDSLIRIAGASLRSPRETSHEIIFINSGMLIAGWVAITLEIILLLVWIYSIFIKPNGTDPAGKGTAMFFVLALSAYIGGGIILMLMQRTWSMILVLIMAGIPLTVVIIGLWKHYGPGRKRPSDF